MVCAKSPKRFHSEISGLGQSFHELSVIWIYSGGTLKVYFWSDSVWCTGKLTAQRHPPTFPHSRTRTVAAVLDGGGKFSSHISWEWKKPVLSTSSPLSSSQWHWKWEEKITEHKLRERRRGFRWKSNWCSHTHPPPFALGLLAEGLPHFCLISASELNVLWVTWQSYWCSRCLSAATEKQQQRFPSLQGAELSKDGAGRGLRAAKSGRQFQQENKRFECVQAWIKGLR